MQQVYMQIRNKYQKQDTDTKLFNRIYTTVNKEETYHLIS